MESRSSYWLVAPSALIFAALFIAPIAFFVVLSFWQVEYFELSTDATLANYSDVFTRYAGVMGYTVFVATTMSVARSPSTSPSAGYEALSSPAKVTGKPALAVPSCSTTSTRLS